MRETNKRLTADRGRSLIDARLTIIAFRLADNDMSNRGAINHHETTPAADAAAAAATVDDDDATAGCARLVIRWITEKPNSNALPT